MRRPLSRLLAIAGSVVLGLGLAGAAAAAAPANGNQLTVTGTAECVVATGDWNIKWQIKNTGNRSATITEVAANRDGNVTTGGDPVEPLLNKVIDQGQTIDAYQSIANSFNSASLRIKAQWIGANPNRPGPTSVDSGTAVFTTTSCAPPVTCVSADEAKYKHTFTGNNKDGYGEAVVRLDGKPLCAGQKQEFLLVSYFAPSEKFALPQYAFDYEVGEITSDPQTAKGGDAVRLKVKLPACWTQVDLVWGGRNELIDPLDGSKFYGEKKLGSGGAPGNRSAGLHGVKGWYNGPGTQGGKCTEPQASYVPACDGSVTVHLSNSGKYASDFVVTAGQFSKNASVPAGKAAEVLVPAGAGEIKVTADGKAVGGYTWKQPEDCPPPIVGVLASCTAVTITVTNPTGSQPIQAAVTYGSQQKSANVAPGKSEQVVFEAGSSTQAKVVIGKLDLALDVTYPTPVDCGWLPTTGAKVGAVTAAGGALVALGAGIFFLARRRRLNLADMA